MGCNSPGATHHAACDCREREWAERLAGADRALFAERERVVRAELRAASLSQELLAARMAREEADAYAGRANARIADLGERLDATEAVLRTAESRAARLAKAGAGFASQYKASAFDCRYDNSCDDSGREPRCEPCELRAALAAEEGK